MEKMNILGLYNNLIFPISFWSICSYLSIMLGNSVVSKKLVMYLIGIKIKIRHLLGYIYIGSKRARGIFCGGWMESWKISSRRWFGRKIGYEMSSIFFLLFLLE